jgi:hypothetical protein
MMLLGITSLVAAAPPSMSFLDPFATDAQSRYYVRALQDWHKGFASLGGTRLDEEEIQERIANYILEKSGYMKRVSKFMTPEKAEQSWQQSVESLKKTLPLFRKLTPPEGASEASRILTRVNEAKMSGSVNHIRSNHMSVSYEFKDTDRYLDRLGKLRSMLSNFFSGQSGWQKIEDDKQAGVRYLSFIYYWPTETGNQYIKNHVQISVTGSTKSVKGKKIISVIIMSLEFLR